MKSIFPNQTLLLLLLLRSKAGKMREYDSYLNDDDEQRDILRFLTIVDQLHKPDGKNTFNWSESIIIYVGGLLHHCSSGAESKEGSSRDNLPEAPEQLLPLIGKIAAEIAWNTINDIGLHNTIIAVLNTLEQYSWATKVTLIVASYILTYGDNGLNLCSESKLMVDHASASEDFLRHSLSVCTQFNRIEFFPVSAIAESNTDPWMVENDEKQMIVAAYSVIRVIVFAASSQLITRSSREDKLGSFSTTWCYNKLKLIYLQLWPIRDQMMKYYSEAEVVEHEDDHHLNISLLLPTCDTAEDIDVYVEGDDLVVITTGQYQKFPVGKKKYEKEHIKAVFDQNKSVLHLTLPKILDPDFLQINVVTPS